jgi:hypothetical protein
LGLDFTYEDPFYDDYKDQVLLPHKLSEQGPFLSQTDVNGNGLDDLYIGGASGHPGSLYLQQKDGTFILKHQAIFDEDRAFEDAHSNFCDVDGDGWPDLIVASGSYEFPLGDERYRPRIYFNDGKGNFRVRKFSFEEFAFSSSCVASADVNGNGSPDLFIGGRLQPGRYPLSGRSGLFFNDGNGSILK